MYSTRWREHTRSLCVYREHTCTRKNILYSAHAYNFTHFHMHAHTICNWRQSRFKIVPGLWLPCIHLPKWYIIFFSKTCFSDISDDLDIEDRWEIEGKYRRERAKLTRFYSSQSLTENNFINVTQWMQIGAVKGQVYCNQPSSYLFLEASDSWKESRSRFFIQQKIKHTYGTKEGSATLYIVYPYCTINWYTVHPFTEPLNSPPSSFISSFMLNIHWVEVKETDYQSSLGLL